MKDHELKRLTNHTVYLTPYSDTDRPILGAVHGKDQTLIIDAGNSEAHASLFLEELQREGINRINSLVLTHWHWDHVFGIPAINTKTTIAHEETKKGIEKMIPLSWADEALDERVMKGTEIEFCAEMIKKEYGDYREITLLQPNVTFNERMELNLGDVHCTIEHVGGDHAHDSSIIFVKEDNVLFLGDCLYPNLYAEKPNYTVSGVSKLLEKIKTYDADFYVLSHQLPLSQVEFQGYVQLLEDLCHLTVEKKGNFERISEALSTQLGRELGEVELEVIHCFVNGYNDEQRLNG